jgi:hypothetical protein
MQFSDGMSFDTSGPLRTICKSDGLYVVGNGLLIPVEDYNEAEALIEKLSPKAKEADENTLPFDLNLAQCSEV